MKFATPLLLSILTVSPAYSQNLGERTPSQKVAGNKSDTTEPPSWLFILEKETQWSLVLVSRGSEDGWGVVDKDRNQLGLLGVSGSQNFGGQVGTQATRVADRSVPGSANKPGQSATNSGKNATPTIISGSPIIFEGNTDDVPWADGAKPKPIVNGNPSAPSS